MEGPQFSSRAESELYRSWGCDVIGMTAMPEAKLAREAELPYALVGMVTDYDCWRQGEAAVEVSAIVAQLGANAEAARRMVEAFAKALPDERAPSPIDTALDSAIITAPESRDPAMLAKLDAIAADCYGAETAFFFRSCVVGFFLVNLSLAESLSVGLFDIVRI
jgi:5'-methylthioadenosine phosphorylase